MYRAYIVQRDYNSNSGGLLLLILARIYCIKIVILDTSSTGEITEHVICPRDQSIFSVTVQRRGDNGIVSINQWHCIHQQRDNIYTLALHMTAGVPSPPILEDDPLPSPWSLDPLPQYVTPVLLLQLEIAPYPKCSDGHPSFSWYRENLMMIKVATSCHID